MSVPILWVCGHRKSGTTLLVNLLDGHPDLGVYPFDLKVLYAMYPRFCRVGGSPDEARARLERVFFAELDHRLRADGCEGALDVARLRERVTGLLPFNEVLQIENVLSALAAALTEQLPGSPLVLKETSVEIYAPWLLPKFPGARMLQVLRDPRDNFAALASGVGSYYGTLGQGRGETLMSLVFRGGTGFRAAVENKRDFPERFRVVRFEELTTQTQSSLEETLGWLGRAWDNRCIAPTVFGAPTAGNSLDGAQFDGVSIANVGRWRERISEDEARVIEHFLGDSMEELGYPRVFHPSDARVAAAEFYAWANDRFFFADPFQAATTIRKPGR